ncbi:NHL repeat protein [Medicago truncatula]|uniref:NHL repeat protein n=1 Tax=Medicago truncatula TaxID=3880 RepID=G7K1F8_MEDTR|nr:NHL repeat protein [Medicago truncatula]
MYGRPKLVAGSAEGYSGHVDEKLREARMNHPKGITVDDRGNIYVADIINMAIRKISLGNNMTYLSFLYEESLILFYLLLFDVIYVGSSYSLLVIDRGKQAIREIQLRFDDCAYQYESRFPLGKLNKFKVCLYRIAMLVGAGFFGYMMAFHVSCT